MTTTRVIVRKSPLTAGYTPQVMRYGLFGKIKDGKPILTWQDVEQMRYDPQISYGLRILRAPIAQAKWKVFADTREAAAFVDRTFRRFWRNSLGHALTSFEYGNSAGEPVYAWTRRRQVFDRLNRLHVNDAKPLEFTGRRRRGEFAGLRVARVKGGSATEDITPPWCWWFALDPEPGSIVGRSRLHGCLEPWREKRGRHGAVDSRRLFHHKCAFTGGVIRYPQGTTDLGTEDSPRIVSNQDIAREILEKFENGGIITLPNTKDPESGDFLWSVEFAKVLGDGKNLIEYTSVLDRETLVGLGIPPELVEAATVGSGYSGRAIPAQVFFSSLDEVIYQLVSAVAEHVVRHLVEVNFGRRVGFDVVPESLAAMVARDAGDAGKPQQQPGAGRPGENQDAAAGDPMKAALAAAGGKPQRLSLDALGRQLGPMREAKCAERVRVYPVRLVRRVAKLAASRHPDLDGMIRGEGGEGWIRLSSGGARSPKGGVTVGGKNFPGGEFIPGDVLAKATDTEKAAITGKATPAPPAGSVPHKLSALAAKLPAEDRTPERWPKVKAAYKAVKAAAFSTAVTVLSKAHEWAPEVLDTALDYSKLSYHHAGDALLASTGISANTWTVIASHTLGKALLAAGVRLSQERPAPDLDTLAGGVLEVLGALHKAASLDTPLPAKSDVAEALREKIAGREKDDATRLSLEAVAAALTRLADREPAPPTVNVPVTVHPAAVTVTPAEVTVPVTVEASPVPNVTVPVTVMPAEVTVPVTVEAPEAPSVTVPVTVETPAVEVTVPVTVERTASGPRTVEFKRDRSGEITGGTIEPK